MYKLLVICGPTATGKTKLALYLAKLFEGELVSADSRQVYKGLDIGTGKEWGDGSVKIWGYNLVDPRREFSVSQYVDFAKETINKIWERKRLPILVGGTGLYIKGVVDGIGTSSVPRNPKLRESLARFTANELYEKLAQLDPVRAANMNTSDKKNPRRLVRAIEVAQLLLKKQRVSMNRFIDTEADVLFVGLTADKRILSELIKNRILRALKMGFEDEIRKLLEGGVSWENQSMTGIGYKSFKDYFGGTKSRDDAVEEWTREEIKYARRQMTWFKADSRINWFDVGSGAWQEEVESLVKRWYSKDK